VHSWDEESRRFAARDEVSTAASKRVTIQEPDDKTAAREAALDSAATMKELATEFFAALEALKGYASVLAEPAPLDTDAHEPEPMPVLKRGLDVVPVKQEISCFREAAEIPSPHVVHPHPTPVNISTLQQTPMRPPEVQCESVPEGTEEEEEPQSSSEYSSSNWDAMVFEPQLLHIWSEDHHVYGARVHASEVPLAREELTDQDVFVLDTGTKVYVYAGASCRVAERFSADWLADHLNSVCRRIRVDKIDEEFWDHLGGVGSVRTARRPRTNSLNQMLPRALEKFNRTSSNCSDESVHSLRRSSGDSVEQFPRQSMRITPGCENSMDIQLMRLWAEGEEEKAGQKVNARDAFVLDVKDTVYVFVGPKCSTTQRHSMGWLALKRQEAVNDEFHWTFLHGQGSISEQLRQQLRLQDHRRRHVRRLPEDVADDKVQFEPVLLHVWSDADEVTGIRQMHVPLTRSSLTERDAFVLDVKDTIYVWSGSFSSKVERRAASLVASAIQRDRGDSTITQDSDARFWKLLGGNGPISMIRRERPVEDVTCVDSVDRPEATVVDVEDPPQSPRQEETAVVPEPCTESQDQKEPPPGLMDAVESQVFSFGGRQDQSDQDEASNVSNGVTDFWTDAAQRSSDFIVEFNEFSKRSGEIDSTASPSTAVRSKVERAPLGARQSDTTHTPIEWRSTGQVKPAKVDSWSRTVPAVRPEPLAFSGRGADGFSQPEAEQSPTSESRQERLEGTKNESSSPDKEFYSSVAVRSGAGRVVETCPFEGQSVPRKGVSSKPRVPKTLRVDEPPLGVAELSKAVFSNTESSPRRGSRDVYEERGISKKGNKVRHAASETALSSRLEEDSGRRSGVGRVSMNPSESEAGPSRGARQKALKSRGHRMPQIAASLSSGSSGSASLRTPAPTQSIGKRTPGAVG